MSDPHLDNAREKTVMDVILRRRSCRNFLEKPIPEKDLLDLVKAGVYAPSGSNAQNQRFLVVSDKDEIERIGRIRWVLPYRSTAPEATRRERKPAGIIGNATALIFVFADASLTNTRNNGEYYLWEALEIQNCSASIENILLLATAKGIASCWVSSSDRMNHTRMLTGQTWRQVFEGYDIPASYKIQGVILLGYPRKYDEDGFPAGEKMHGVTWGPVDRKELDHYLVKKSEGKRPKELSGFDALKKKVYTRLLRFFLLRVQGLDKRLYKLENGSDKQA